MQSESRRFTFFLCLHHRADLAVDRYESSGRAGDRARVRSRRGSRLAHPQPKFLSSYQKEEMSLSDLCREFGVSRPTGYRWINRYKEVGPEGLLDLSRKPHGCSHATSEATENAILALRSKHPSWGARKLKARLEKIQPSVDWPAASTFGNILSRAGLVPWRFAKCPRRPHRDRRSLGFELWQRWACEWQDQPTILHCRSELSAQYGRVR